MVFCQNSAEYVHFEVLFFLIRILGEFSKNKASSISINRKICKRTTHTLSYCSNNYFKHLKSSEWRPDTVLFLKRSFIVMSSNNFKIQKAVHNFVRLKHWIVLNKKPNSSCSENDIDTTKAPSTLSSPSTKSCIEKVLESQLICWSAVKWSWLQTN